MPPYPIHKKLTDNLMQTLRRESASCYTTLNPLHDSDRTFHFSSNRAMKCRIETSHHDVQDPWQAQSTPHKYLQTSLHSCSRNPASCPETIQADRGILWHRPERCISPPELNKHTCAHPPPTEPAGYSNPIGRDALALKAAMNMKNKETSPKPHIGSQAA